MKITRLTQPLFATIFVIGGARTWRNPTMAAKTSGPFLARLGGAIPGKPGELLRTRPQHAVRANAAVQTVAGVALAIDVYPRIASAGLAVSLLPTTLAGHPYWKFDDPKDRGNHRAHFLKNASLIGALLTRIAHPSNTPARGATPQADAC